LLFAKRGVSFTTTQRSEGGNADGAGRHRKQ
jgi:hypothetical protein